MQPDKIFKTVVCHEFGHVLAFLLSGGQVADVDTIEFQNTAANVDGHTKINPCISLTDDQKIFVLFGGIAAENVCGYSTAFLHPGTDADKLNTITDKGRQKTVKKAVLDALTPYKKTLDALTAATIADYTRQGCPDYYRIFHDSIINYYYTMIDQNQTPEPEPATDADQTPEPGANSERTPRNREPEPDQTAGTLPNFDGITPPAAGDLPFMDAGDWDTPDDWDAPDTWDTDLQPWDTDLQPWDTDLQTWDTDLQPWDTDLQPWDDADDTPPETYPQTPTETPTNSNGDDEPGTDKDFDRYAADVQNGYGYYDAAGTFHYYANYWD